MKILSVYSFYIYIYLRTYNHFNAIPGVTLLKHFISGLLCTIPLACPTSRLFKSHSMKRPTFFAVKPFDDFPYIPPCILFTQFYYSPFFQYECVLSLFFLFFDFCLSLFPPSLYPLPFLYLRLYLYFFISFAA